MITEAGKGQKKNDKWVVWYEKNKKIRQAEKRQQLIPKKELIQI